MSEHIKCSASPMVCITFTSSHSSCPAVPLRLARSRMPPAGDQKRPLHTFFSQVLSSETRPLCLEPMVWMETSVRFEPPSACTTAKRRPLGSHAKARMVVSLENSCTSMGTPLSRRRKSSKAELRVFFDFECLSTLTQRKWPCSCHVMRRSATEKRFFCRSSEREGSSIKTTLAGWFMCSGAHRETTLSVGDQRKWRTPSALTEERLSCLSLMSFIEHDS
mmetsp:Transcript_13238/g.28585  ORF Transcript_13238/g.28585 Transcript_13238/m.28585 type:complete len:220 (-) Transcript_13238:923-1582(-)